MSVRWFGLALASILCLDTPSREAVTYEWIAPLQQFLAAPATKRPSVKRDPSIMAKVIDKPASLMHQAALRAFWDISKECLLWFCKYYGVAYVASASLLQVLKALGCDLGCLGGWCKLDSRAPTCSRLAHLSHPHR